MHKRSRGWCGDGGLLAVFAIRALVPRRCRAGIEQLRGVDATARILSRPTPGGPRSHVSSSERELSLQETRSRCAHCSVYRCNLLFNPGIRVCRIVHPTSARILALLLRQCSVVVRVRLHLQLPRLATCAIPSAIGNSRRRADGALSPPLPFPQSTPERARRLLFFLTLQQRLLLSFLHPPPKMLVPRA